MRSAAKDGGLGVAPETAANESADNGVLQLDDQEVAPPPRTSSCRLMEPGQRLGGVA